MSDRFLDFVILALVAWLVYDRMQQKKAAVPPASATATPSTKEQVEAMLAA